MAELRRRKKDHLVALAAVSRQVVDATDDDIAIRAYALYEQRGGEHGHALDDLLQADHERRPSLRSPAASPTGATPLGRS